MSDLIVRGVGLPCRPPKEVRSRMRQMRRNPALYHSAISHRPPSCPTLRSSRYSSSGLSTQRRPRSNWRIARSPEHRSSRVVCLLTMLNLVAPVVLALVVPTPVAAQWRNCGPSAPSDTVLAAACVDAGGDGILRPADATLRVECRQGGLGRVMPIVISWNGYSGSALAQWIRLTHVFVYSPPYDLRPLNFRTLRWRVNTYRGGFATTLGPGQDGYRRFVSNLSEFNYLLIGFRRENLAGFIPENLVSFGIGSNRRHLGRVYEACHM